MESDRGNQFTVSEDFLQSVDRACRTLYTIPRMDLAPMGNPSNVATQRANELKKILITVARRRCAVHMNKYVKVNFDKKRVHPDFQHTQPRKMGRHHQHAKVTPVSSDM